MLKSGLKLHQQHFKTIGKTSWTLAKTASYANILSLGILSFDSFSTPDIDT